jgi:hypothetical protein
MDENVKRASKLDTTALSDAQAVLEGVRLTDARKALDIINFKARQSSSALT